MTYLESLWSVLSASLAGVWSIIAGFVPALLLAIVLFIIGVVIASVISNAIAQVIRVTKVDRLFESAGAGAFFNKIGLKLDIGKFFGVIIKWFIVVVFLMASLQIIQLTQVSQFIGEMVILYLPKVVIIIIILMLAAIIADAFKKIVITGAKAASIATSEVLGSIAKYAVWVVAIMLVFSQFDGIKDYVLVIFIGIVSFLVIAGGLAFGLGGKEQAARTIEKISNEMSTK